MVYRATELWGDGPTYGVIYARESKHKDGRSVDSQIAESCKWCEAQGVIVKRIFRDDGKSGSRHGRVVREDYNAMVEYLAEPPVPIRVLVAWASARTTRQTREYLDVRDLCEERNLLYAYSGRVYDMRRTDDRFVTLLDAALAERGADEIRDNVLRGKLTGAEAGRPSGRRLFGHLRIYDEHDGTYVRTKLHPEEWPIVLEICQRVFHGDPLYRIAKGLNMRGLLNRGKAWTTNQVRRVALNPAHAALRVHQGRIVGAGAWPAIVSVEMWEANVARLANPKRTKHDGTKLKYFGSGVITCAVCGVGVRPHKWRDVVAYHLVCPRGHVAAPRERAARFVRGLVVARFSKPDVLDLLVPERNEAQRDADAAELETLRERWAKVREMGTRGAVPDEYVAGVWSDIGARLSLLEEQASASVPVIPEPIQRLADAARPAPVWDAMPLPLRHEILGKIADVRLKKSTILNRGWIPDDRVSVDWRRLG